MTLQHLMYIMYMTNLQKYHPDMKETKQKNDEARLDSESRVLTKLFQPKSSHEVEHGDLKKKILSMQK